MNTKSLSSAFLAAILVGGLLLAGAVCFGTVQGVSGVSDPSVPEFTLEYVDKSYDVPPVYGIDQYTRKSIITEGYHVDNRVHNQEPALYFLC